MAQIKAREQARTERREALGRARQEARASVQVRQSRLSEAGLAAILARSPKSSQRRTAARRRLKALRSPGAERLLGWRNIRDVARALGMSRGKLGKILAGTHDPRLSELRALARILDEPLPGLVEALEPPTVQ